MCFPLSLLIVYLLGWDDSLSQLLPPRKKTELNEWLFIELSMIMNLDITALGSLYLCSIWSKGLPHCDHIRFKIIKCFLGFSYDNIGQIWHTYVWNMPVLKQQQNISNNTLSTVRWISDVTEMILVDVNWLRRKYNYFFFLSFLLLLSL